MKHSARELVDIAYQLFPKGLQGDEPDHGQTPEVLRQKAARVPASARYDDWRALLQRLRDRLPPERYPAVEVHNQSMFLQVATAEDHDRCFTGQLWLPVREGELHHILEFVVSFVVPYFAIRSERQVPRAPGSNQGDVTFETSFTLSPDEAPFAQAIAEEIGRTFPGHEPIDPDVGHTLVPGVATMRKPMGEATIFTCLFSDWW